MAGQVITVAQQKGGAGKTTLVTHLAVALAQSGQSVAVVDIDPQGSLSRWMETREAAGPEAGQAPLTHRQITGWRTQGEVEKLARDHDWVLIDSPPHMETEARIAMRAAALVLVPVQPSPMDLWATRPTLDMAASEKRPTLIVLNRVPPRGRVADNVIAAVDALGVPVAECRIGNRLPLAAALIEGRTVTEGRKSRAGEEIAALAAEIRSRLGL